jgi:hypothetical protein
MKSLTILHLTLLLLLMCQHLGVAQGSSPENKKSHETAAVLYREGYNSILKKKWDEARSVLADLVRRFPQSEYVDDAEYWSAYALSQTTPDLATKVYSEFLRKHPESSYADDVNADLLRLYAHTLREASSPQGAQHPKAAAEVAAKMKQSYIAGLEHSMQTFNLVATSWLLYEKEEEADPITRLRIAALRSLTREAKDPSSLILMKKLALDPKEPVPLRIAACEAMSAFEEKEYLPVFLEMFRMDTSAGLQIRIIQLIGRQTKDKQAATQALVTLYKSFPSGHTRQLEVTLYIIAEIGNEPAVELLSQVAESSQNYDLRNKAVYYLGNIGGVKARAALQRILEHR